MKLNDCRKMKDVPVIYGIKNVITNKWYIGSCLSLRKRMCRHRYYLRHNKHHSSKLQRSYNLYGEDAFEIHILKELSTIDTVEIIETENVFIKAYESIKDGYNMIEATPMYHRGQSEEAKQKAAKSHMIKIVCINRFTNEVYKIYESLTEAAKELELETTNISNVCKGRKLRYLKDYTFRYFSDYDPFEDYTVKEHCMKGVPKTGLWLQRMKENSYNAKKVYKYDLQGNFVCQYSSRLEAERQNGFKKEFLRKHLDVPIDNYIYTHTQK